MKMLRLLLPFIALFILYSACSKPDSKDDPGPIIPSNGLEHPFLIVKKEQYGALRAKADTEPWKSMKADAIARSNAGLPAGGSGSSAAYDLQFFIGAAALAYILDEGNAQVHAERVRDAILKKYATLSLKDGSDWSGVVPPMGSFFVAVLSLDIVYDALSAEEIQQCENVISNQIFKIARGGSWADVRRGTHGTWDIYKGDRTEPDNEYYAGIIAQITEDGVSPVTVHYAWERVGGGDSRISKSGYMDVLEFTGIDQRYYNHDRLQKFQRWLFGSSVNTAKEMCIIGDMLPTQGLGNHLLHRRVVNFDMEAAAYAAWFHEGEPAKGHILTYVVPKEPLPAPKVPESQLYEDGGAFFREKPDDPNGLHAVLYNIKAQEEWHTHQEVNGLALSGYGNRLLVNGGRLGAPTRPAPLNNTLSINGSEHNSRNGDGLLEGFTTNEFDYACGSEGGALSNADHLRSLLLVHAADGAQAYCLLFDEVKAQAGDRVNNYLHPANQSVVTELAAGMEYTANIDHYPTVPGAKLSFFYATPPLEVKVEKVPSAVPDRYPGYPDHNRLESIYETDGNGHKNLLTILFPHNASHPKAAFSRIEQDGFAGGSIAQGGNVIDFAFESNELDQETYEGVVFQAKASLYRKINGALSFYFVRKGTHFLYQGLGFDADAPVSIYFKQKEGVVISEGTRLTLKGPGVESLTFEPAATILNSSADLVEVELPAGTVTFR